MDGLVMRALNKETVQIDGRMRDPQLVSSIRRARHLCSSMSKKGAGLALTSLVTLRHNQIVREKPALRNSSRPATDV
jgi:hypothetical protein